MIFCLVGESRRRFKAWATGVKLRSTVRFQLTGFSTILEEKVEFPELIKIVSNCSIEMRKKATYINYK